MMRKCTCTHTHTDTYTHTQSRMESHEAIDKNNMHMRLQQQLARRISTAPETASTV